MADPRPFPSLHAPPEDDPLIGSVVVGRYRIQRLLGEGGMGQVYQALHQAIEKPVALKILKQEYSRKRDIVTRFHQEAVSASRIKHPNVLDVFDFGQIENGCFFLAMELLEGNDLADELTRQRSIAPNRAVRIATQTAKALAAAHARGVVHRDLKPENVFLQRTPDGEEHVKIVDFGIAQLRSNDEVAALEPNRRRLTRTGMIFGTPEYMAPEQAAGRSSDARADIYALGVLLYEMLSGAVPFTGDTFMGVLAAHLNDPVPPMHKFARDISVTPELEAVVMLLLAKDPDARPQTMSEVAHLLAAVPEAAHSGIISRESEPPNRLRSAHVPHLEAAPLPGEARADRQQETLIAAVPGAHWTAAQGTRSPSSSPYAAPQPSGTSLGSVAPGPASSPSHLPGPRVPGSMAPPENLASWVPQDAYAPAPHGSPWLVRALAWVGGAAVLAAAALGLTTMLPRGVGEPSRETSTPPGPASGVSASAPSSAATGADAARAAAPTQSAAPTQPASARGSPSAEVRLHVQTEPPGAVLFLDGAQVCDKTPCDVLAAPHVTVQLEARRAGSLGKIRVLPQRDQSVSIALAAPRPKAPEARLCERYDPALDIKITVPCP
jgi:serine/threonine-protein kinase